MEKSLSWGKPFVRIVSHSEAGELKAWINGPGSLITGNPVLLTPGFSQVDRADLKSETVKRFPVLLTPDHPAEAGCE
jgi:hypothetical protein